MKPLFLFCVFLLFFSPAANSQNKEVPKGFISAFAGGFMIAKEEFGKVYDSDIVPAYGIGLGIPVTDQGCIYGKLAYLSKTGVPVIYTRTYQNGHLVSINETRDGTAAFNDWMINAGLQYNPVLSSDYMLNINLFLTYSWISEELRSSIGGSSSEKVGVPGIALGLGLDRKLGQSDFSLFIESQYNYSRTHVIQDLQNYGGTSLTLGLRYHFKDRRRP